MKHRPLARQRGMSLTTLIVLVIIVGAIAVLGMKIVPSVIEYYSIKKALVAAKEAGSTEREIRNSFDRLASATYIDTLKGSDLEITRVDGGLEVSFEYQKKIPLVGPASLVIDFEGTTARKSPLKGGKAKSY